jgi:hypothetical protein
VDFGSAVTGKVWYPFCPSEIERLTIPIAPILTVPALNPAHATRSDLQVCPASRISGCSAAASPFCTDPYGPAPLTKSDIHFWKIALFAKDEIRLDGYQMCVDPNGDRVRLITRGGYDWTKRFPLALARQA